jgi:16S rRNA C1402 (ribose-2'-O) methylase RsmI
MKTSPAPLSSERLAEILWTARKAALGDGDDGSTFATVSARLRTQYARFADEVAKQLAQDRGGPAPSVGKDPAAEVAQLRAELDQKTRWSDSVEQRLEAEKRAHRATREQADELRTLHEEFLEGLLQHVTEQYEDDTPGESIIITWTQDQALARDRAIRDAGDEVAHRQQLLEQIRKAVADEQVAATPLAVHIAQLIDQARLDQPAPSGWKERAEELVDAAAAATALAQDAEAEAKEEARTADVLRANRDQLHNKLQAAHAYIEELKAEQGSLAEQVKRAADVDLIRRAISDPGAFLQRERLNGDDYESLPAWGARAVVRAYDGKEEHDAARAEQAAP